MSSAQIELIKQLRDRTGAGLMDCKKAIVACENDAEKAIVWLREKGLSKVAKKANRVAAEGKSWIEESGDDAVIFEVNSETDFVSESPAFGDLVKEIGKVLIEKKPATLEEATEMVSSICADGTMRMGEKIVLRRLKWIHKSAGENIGTYIHMKGKIAVAVVLKGGDKAFADDIAVSLCSSLPTYIFESEIPAEVVKKETEIEIEASKADPKFASKTQAIQEKIVEGRVRKNLNSQVFVDQEFILDTSKVVGQVLKEHGAEIVSTVRFTTGEGIEKAQSDFAAEVAAQLNNK